MSKLDEFLAGERLDDVALFLSDEFLAGEDGGTDRLADYGTAVDGGIVLVVDGERGRRLFATATGMKAMEFAKHAMDTDGRIDRDLGGGDTPDGADVQFVFAFAEARNEEAGGLYAEGDVVHAYAYAADGTAFSDRWTVGAE
jgi:hypothetical protein